MIDDKDSFHGYTVLLKGQFVTLFIAYFSYQNLKLVFESTEYKKQYCATLSCQNHKKDYSYS